MTVGVRLRDAATGQVVLDFTDFTVRTVYSQIVTISAPTGYISVPGINPANAGAFLVPAHQTGYPYQPGMYAGEYRSSMPKISVGTDSVSWVMGANQPAATWYLLVVKYE